MKTAGHPAGSTVGIDAPRMETRTGLQKIVFPYPTPMEYGTGHEYQAAERRTGKPDIV
jgi:hypothetical protein